MDITLEQITKAVPSVNRQRAMELVEVFNAWNEKFGITTPLRIVHLLSQIMHESRDLNSLEENLNYSADRLLVVFPKYFNKINVNLYARNPQKIANRVYANRMGNGSEASGDGWKYRGRGYLQLTGKNQYIAFSKYDLCTEDVVKNPDAVAKYFLNQMASMWFWEKNGLNDISDFGDVTKATAVINGGKLGLNTRQLLYRRFSREFGIKKL